MGPGVVIVTGIHGVIGVVAGHLGDIGEEEQHSMVVVKLLP